MATTSYGTTVKWGETTMGEVVSVSVSGAGPNFVDITSVDSADTLLMAGTHQSVVVTVVALEKNTFDAPTIGDDESAASAKTLELKPGNTDAVSYYNMMVSDKSVSVTVDAVVEYTTVFTGTKASA